MNARIRRLGLVLIVLFACLLVNLTWLQVVHAPTLANAAGNTRNAARDFARARGPIQTSDGVVLAQTVPSDDAFERQRQYPEGALFGNVTGFFSFTFGTDGVERAFNGELTGRRLPVRHIADVLGDRVTTGTVTLTLTKRAQAAARDALGDRKGAVVALDPTTGAVLALWSNPSYDPSSLAGHDLNSVRDLWTRLQTDPGKPMLARAYRERYAPGSTFKVVTAAAALEKAPELVAKPYPTLRALDLPQTDRDLPNFGNKSCGGTLPDLLRVSCNTGFAQMGLDLGAQRLTSEAGQFGFGKRPPLDLPAVATSFFPEADSFAHDVPALAKSAIGQQDVAATPLEMALVAAGVANGGLIMKPHVLAEVTDSEGAVIRTYQPEAWQRATTPAAALSLRDMMIEVVNHGTATRAALPGIQVAAKTGTAQTVGDNAHAWLVAFAPADAPRVAVAVIVESQPGLGDVTGGRIAAPVAAAVLRAVLSTPPAP